MGGDPNDPYIQGDPIFQVYKDDKIYIDIYNAIKKCFTMLELETPKFQVYRFFPLYPPALVKVKHLSKVATFSGQCFC